MIEGNSISRRSVVAGLLSVPLAGAVVGTTTPAHAARDITGNQTGRYNGRFFSYWKDTGSARMTLGDYPGNYAVDWNLGSGNFVGGVGWSRGSPSRVVGYNAGAWRPRGNAYLCLYGWTTGPLIEYYVVDSWGDWRPPGGRRAGRVYSNGAYYDLYRTRRVDAPSILGRRTFYQYWSVRRNKRVTGSNVQITFANHVRAWRNRGWDLGAHDYQIMATEGFQSSGYSNLTVWRA